MSRASVAITSDNLIDELGKSSKVASLELAKADSATINRVLSDIADLIDESTEEIISANYEDVAQAHSKGLSESMIDRLCLNKERINAISNSVRKIIELDDPTGKTISKSTPPNGLLIKKISVPIGVLGMIYESRPNVTVDAAALSLKSHNAIILRGGSESLNSSLILHGIIQKALIQNNLPEACVNMVPYSDRELVTAMLQAKDYIDVIIPRGGKNLVAKVMSEALMPVFSHLEGLCHTYVHNSADIEKACKVVVNAKMRRTSICGATETLLIDRKLGDESAKQIINALLNAGCAIVGTQDIQRLDSRITSANDDDWSTEYLDAKISVRLVNDYEDAVNYINNYGSHHTDAIIAEDKQAFEYFLKFVDSGIVMLNASTQFADGGEFGMGAEIGISTGKLHARGPVGLEQLTTYKYQVIGNGSVRS